MPHAQQHPPAHFHVSTERVDRRAADRTPPRPGARDRPVFDLGGSAQAQPGGPTTGNVMPRAPRGTPGQGGKTTGRASGATRLSGSRSLGEAGEPGSAAGSGPTDGRGEPS